jgi:hypothetical protein
MGMGAASSLTTAPGVEQRERSFFFFIATAISATVVAGFGSFALLGISSFSAPWWVHVHAISFVAWIALFLTQAHLVLRGNTGRHRQLGQLGAGLALWMVVVGMLLTPATVAAGRLPPFFTPAQFLALDWVNIVCFAALAFAGLRLRKRTDWHRRLMLCATICVIAPALGRLLVLADAISVWNIVGMLLVYVVVAMAADWFIRGRVHPAYFWGFGAIFAMAPTINALALLAPLQDLATRLVG